MQGTSPELELGAAQAGSLGAIPSACQRDWPAAKGQLRSERGRNPFHSTKQSLGHSQGEAGGQQKAQLCGFPAWRSAGSGPTPGQWQGFIMGKHRFVSPYKTSQLPGTAEARAARMGTETEEICSTI